MKINGKWEHYSAPAIRRNYALFAKMANVRNDGSICHICQPKGLPDNLSIITRMAFDKDEPDAHSISWFNPEEIKEATDFHIQTVCDVPDHIPDEQYSKYLEERAKKGCPDTRWLDVHEQWGYLFGNHPGGFIEYREEFPPEIEDVRLIFWFDN